MESVNVFGLDPFLVLGVATLGSGAVGWLLGPFVGERVFGLVYWRVGGWVGEVRFFFFFLSFFLSFFLLFWVEGVRMNTMLMKDACYRKRKISTGG